MTSSDPNELPTREELEQLRPRVRGDCADGPRPCPWVGCRYHLLLRVQEANGTIMFNHADYRAEETVIASSEGPVSVSRGESRSLNARKVAGGIAAIRAMINWAAEERLWELPETCALDVADRGTHTCAQVAELLSTDRERVRQIAEAGMPKLRAGLEDWKPSDHEDWVAPSWSEEEE